MADDEILGLMTYLQAHRSHTTSLHEIVPGLWLGDQIAACGGFEDASEVGAEEQTARLQSEFGITAVVCCMDPDYHLNSAETRARWHALHAAYRNASIEVLMLPMSDGSDGVLEPFTEQGADFIQEHLGPTPDSSRKVLVHCSMGKSRSPSVVATFLMKHRGMSLREAMLLMRSRRVRAYPIQIFWLQLIAVEKGLRDGVSSLSEASIEELYNYDPSAPQPGSEAANHQALIGMGFSEAASLQTLHSNGNDLDAAIHALLGL